MNPAPLTVTATAYSVVYGSAAGTPPQLTFSGFINGTDASSVPAEFVPFVSAAPGSSTGTYAIKLQNENPDSDYAVTYVGANLTSHRAAEDHAEPLQHLWRGISGRLYRQPTFRDLPP